MARNKPSESDPESTQPRVLQVEDLRAAPELVGRRCYWLGLLPSAPLSSVTCGGVSFQVETNSLRYQQLEPSRHQSVNDGGHGRSWASQRGCTAFLTDAEVEHIAKKLSQRVVRWRGAAVAGANPPGSELAPGAMAESSKGSVVRIYTAEERAALRENNLTPWPDAAGLASDEPLARYVWLVPSEPMLHGLDEPLPPTVEQVGIAISGPIYCEGDPSERVLNRHPNLREPRDVTVKLTPAEAATLERVRSEHAARQRGLTA